MCDPSSGSSSGLLDTPFFLKAFLHELGHALHFLLSAQPRHQHQPQAQVQAGPQPQAGPQALPSLQPQPQAEIEALPLLLLSASSCPTDLKEVPSHLFEHFAKDGLARPPPTHTHFTLATASAHLSPLPGCRHDLYVLHTLSRPCAAHPAPPTCCTPCPTYVLHTLTHPRASHPGPPRTLVRCTH